MPDYRKIAAQKARKYGVDPSLFVRQIGAESGFNPRAVSPAGAVGIAQIVPRWHPTAKPNNPRLALDYAAKLMASSVRKYGNYRDALSVYNSGRPWAEGRNISETRNYVSKIMDGLPAPGAARATRAPGRPGRPGTPGTPGIPGTPGRTTTRWLPPAPISMGLPKLGEAPTGLMGMAMTNLGRIAQGESAQEGLSDLVSEQFRQLDRPWRQVSKRIPGTPATPGTPGTPGRPATPGGRVVNAPKIGRLVQPVATKPGASAFDMPDAEGAPDKNGVRHHAAMDWFAPGGSRVLAPVGGKIVEVKQSRTNTGQIFGGVVKIQQPNGRVFVFRHVDPRGVKLGQRVKPGTVIGGVSPWESGSPHTHIEVWKSLAGGYRLENMEDPARYFH